MFGIDPDEARREIEAMIAPQAGSDQTDEILSARNRDLWEEWIASYKKALPTELSDQARWESMGKVNPKFVLRNYLLEEAIRDAEDKEDFSRIEALLALAKDPYGLVPEEASKPPPKWAYNYCVSCSS